MSVPLLDTHQHLIYADRLRYSVAEEVSVLAHRSFPYADYLAAISGTGIDSTIFMETTPDEWEQEFDLVYPLYQQPGSLMTGIIAQCPLENASGVEPWLEAHMGRGLAGIRRVCHTEPDDFSSQDAFVRNVALLGRYQLTFDLCFLGRQLPSAIRLARCCSQTQMVLDHCGVPDIAHGEWDTWKASIAEIARLPNVACKLSGVLAYCRSDDATLSAVRPYVEFCIESFGWDRLVWGSDWPFCLQTTTVQRWVEVSREFLRYESIETQQKVFLKTPGVFTGEIEGGVTNPIFGVGLHGIGAFSSALCYTPQKKTRQWSWQTYWMAQAAVCWLLLPIVVAAMTTPHMRSVLSEAPGDAMLRSFMLGFCYGVGGTAFGVAIRFLGFSMTYALSVGISCVLGTLLPPLLAHKLSGLLRQTGSGWVFSGIAVAGAAILFSGVAGKLRDRDHSHRQATGTGDQPNLKKGLFFALVAGILSAVFGLALAAGQPIANVAYRYGAGKFQGNVILIFACGGAFVSTAILCLYLHWKEGSLHEYITFADGPSRSLLAANLTLATLTGLLWYGQFFFYGIAHTYMGKYQFTSWALHMAMLVLFSAFVGIYLKEWNGCRKVTLLTLTGAIAVLLGALASITYGSYLGAA